MVSKGGGESQAEKSRKGKRLVSYSKKTFFWCHYKKDGSTKGNHCGMVGKINF
jgi:hypothetical protein